MPDFQHNDFALVDGQRGEAAHGGALGRTFHRRLLEPSLRFEFARQAPPQGATMVQRVISETPDTVMLRPKRAFRLLHEREECLLQDIFRLGMAEPQRAAIENQPGRFRFVQLFAPITHDFIG